MHQFGYEVEKEPRYTVRIKGIAGYSEYPIEIQNTIDGFLHRKQNLKDFRAHHTRKELEDAGFRLGFLFLRRRGSERGNG